MRQIGLTDEMDTTRGNAADLGLWSRIIEDVSVSSSTLMRVPYSNV